MRKDAIEGTSGSVSSEEELRAALARGLTPITLTGCFSINGADSLVVDYNAEIIGGGCVTAANIRYLQSGVSEHLDGIADHVVVHARHVFIMFLPETRRQILAFLDTGRFLH